MRALFVLLAVSTSLVVGGARAATPPPNWVGIWQGTLPVLTPQGVRVVIHITRKKAGELNASMFIDNADPIPVTSVLVNGSKIELIGNGRTYQGTISANRSAIQGTWTRGNPRVLDYPWDLVLRRATRQTTWSLSRDPSLHSTRYITVDRNVSLEVLDWGGSGRPVVLLAGLGGTAHVFDQFAPKLTSKYHVYGITRRGFGNSSTPMAGYSADRLGDDVMEVCDALHLDRPILVGHSLAGEELSSIGSRYPPRVAGLVYLDAGYSYAYDDGAKGDRLVDIAELRAKLEQIEPANAPADPRALIQELLETELPRITQDLQAWQQDLPARATAASAAQLRAPPPRPVQVDQDVEEGVQRYTSIPVPILAIFAVPHEIPASVTDPAARAAADALDEIRSGGQATAFEKGVPSAHVVRLPHANHNVFRSNESDVLHEMDAFIAALPR